MKDVILGHDASGNPIHITAELRRQTHTHVIGSSGRGKSKFLEWLIRQDIQAGHGLCVIDWHGTLYKDVLAYCSEFKIGQPRWGGPDFRSLILIDPSSPDFISGFNPFANTGEDVSTQVSWRINATLRPWGVSDSNSMPTFERIARLLYTFMAETGHTLPNAAALLDPERKDLREYAMATAGDSYIKSQWRRLQTIKTLRDWEEKVLSTENRIGRFIGSQGVRRFMGLTEGNIDLMNVVDSGKILLVNLGPSGFLDRDAARVFASLLVYEFMRTGMIRANRSQIGIRPNHYILYLDEFQEYITDDIAAMLEQVRKGGLHMVLAHQHLAQLIQDGNERLKDSILTNCRIKAVFGGLPYNSAEELASEMFLPDLNARQIKATYEHTIHLYDEETRVQRSKSRGKGEVDGTNWAHSEGTADGRGFSSGSGTGAAHGTVLGSISARGESIRQGASEVINTRSLAESRVQSSAFSDSSFASESESQSRTESDTQGGSKSHSSFQAYGETVGPFLKPRAVKEKLPDVEWTLEEKRSRAAQMIIDQPQRHCFVKLDTAETVSMMVEPVKNYGVSVQSLLDYQREVFRRQGALPASEVDRLLQESERRFFLTAASVTESGTTDSHGVDPIEGSAETLPPIKAPEKIWNRVEDRSDPIAAEPPAPPSKRGPKPDIKNHLKVKAIVSRFSPAWATEDEALHRICEALDNEKVPIPDSWPERKPPARSWTRALSNHRDRGLVVKTIRDRVKWATPNRE